ncbi:hypothetical protein [Vibrio phage vB_VibM_10AMN]|uniref:Uncharacterized protein n=1 Tax=Staphylococcus phage vB_VibM_10AMN12 TaxID=3076785 RepID=A0AA96KSP5_9CAUD|nr:hypothetical protein [Vibrio phage vB_VibM_10AMN]WNO47450.1 hypothetical protein [Staphylococcus phage vB_VibM_10AMN12]
MSDKLPKVLIVGGVSKSFQGMYEQLLKSEASGELVIIHKDIGEDLTEDESPTHTLSDKLRKGLLDGSIVIDELSNLNEEIITYSNKPKHEKNLAVRS